MPSAATERNAVLVTGISGGLAQRVALTLRERGRTVVGVDYRKATMPASLDGMPVYQANYNKTAIEDIFKRHGFREVLHLGRVGNLKESVGKRFDLNVIGSQKIMNLCLQHRVRRLVVLSTFHIYGADPGNHIPIAEDDPIGAGTEFPQLADAIQLDNMATRWVWQHAATVKTVVLRPTNVVGPTIHNTMSSFLRASRVPHLLGFNPMTQFVHEADLADAILRSAEGDLTGVYNVAGAGAVPWRSALELAGAQTFPLPSLAVAMYLRAFSSFPAYLVNFFKYPCVITDAAFRRDYGWEPQVALRETIWSTVAEARARG